MALTNITQKRKDANDFTWHNLTEGKLRALYRLCNDASPSNPLAHDCAHEIYNFFYEHRIADSLPEMHKHDS